MIPLTKQTILIHAHILDALEHIPSKSIQVVMTSPPYWGMRRYETGSKAWWPDGIDVQFGTEPKPEEYIERTRIILSQLKDKLRDDGVIWWNIRDTYFTRTIIRQSSTERLDAFEGRRKDSWKDSPLKRSSSGHSYLKDKDLTLIPFIVAYEAQKLGYWVRSIIIWEKGNQIPEPQFDRPVFSHEYILMLTKSKHYKWNKSAALEMAMNGKEDSTRLLRSVWTMKSSSGRNGHPAPFPENLVERCLKVSTDENDLVFDPFVGSGTSAIVAYRMNRRFIGVDIVESYVRQACDALREQFPGIQLEYSDAVKDHM